MMNEIYEATNISCSIPAKVDELKVLLEEIEKTGNEPKIVKGLSKENYTWFELFMYNKIKTQEEISKLFIMTSRLDVELIKICSTIDDSKFYWYLNECKIFGKEFKQFSQASSSFHELVLAMFELYKYSLKNNIIKFTKNEKMYMDFFKKAIKKGVTKDQVDKFRKSSEKPPIQE